jgi:hypothetical protein
MIYIFVLIFFFILFQKFQFLISFRFEQIWVWSNLNWNKIKFEQIWIWICTNSSLKKIWVWTNFSLNKFEFEQIQVWTNLNLNKFEFEQFFWFDVTFEFEQNLVWTNFWITGNRRKMETKLGQIGPAHPGAPAGVDPRIDAKSVL